MKKLFIPVVTLCMVTFFAGCSSMKELTSKWSDNKIVIDGSQEDWQNKLNYNTDEGIAYGFCNDSENLYVCLTTGNRGRMFQLMRAGFIVWFEPVNNGGKMIGIEYPVGETIFTSDEEKNMAMEPDKETKMKDFTEGMITRLQLEQNEFIILNKEKFPLTAFPLQNKAGIEIKLGYHLQQFVYELKIPLKGLNTEEYGVYTLPGDIVKVGLQTEEFDRSKLSNRNPMSEGDRTGEGGFSGSGGRRGMGGGGRRGSGGAPMQQVKQLDFWVKLNLVKSAEANIK